MKTLADFLDLSKDQKFVFYAKRLSGNDTLANGSHQAGPYIPKALLFKLFPDWRQALDSNQDAFLCLELLSHQQTKEIRAVWYNNKYRDGTRDEARFTNFGGASSPILAPESTGSLIFFAFELVPSGHATACHAWLAKNETEEDALEAWFGPIDPGETFLSSGNGLVEGASDGSLDERKCWLIPDEVPEEWFTKFPTGLEIIEKSLSLGNYDAIGVDKRLIKRRDCEYELFRSVEEAVELPDILSGFKDIDSFLQKAQSMVQRRKSRSGRSLELHTKAIFEEEGLQESRDYSWQEVSEHGKQPDFMFPSVNHYRDTSFPDSKLRMLAIKTTCKDRWRQVLNEANRINKKHLLTLQQGVSESQFEEMRQENVQLVVPAPVKDQFKKSIRSELLTLDQFIHEVRSLQTV